MANQSFSNPSVNKYILDEQENLDCKEHLNGYFLKNTKFIWAIPEIANFFLKCSEPVVRIRSVERIGDLAFPFGRIRVLGLKTPDPYGSRAKK